MLYDLLIISNKPK